MEKQIELMGYITKNFDVCPKALKTFNYLKSLVPDMAKESRDDLFSALQYQDAMFGIEKSLYEIGSTEVPSSQVEEAMMLSHLVTYSIGMISAEMDLDLIEMFDYLPMHLEQIRYPYKKINSSLPDKNNSSSEEKDDMEEKKISKKEYGEGRMVRASLKKIIMYSGALLGKITPDQELEAWIQDKISIMDHSIEAVYTYYMFGENDDKEEYESEGREESEEEQDYSAVPPTARLIQPMYALSVQHSTLGFGMCIPNSQSVDKKGNVKSYDVVFYNGIAKNVPTSDLKMLEPK
jgi:hypothetical protein